MNKEEQRAHKCHCGKTYEAPVVLGLEVPWHVIIGICEECYKNPTEESLKHYDDKFGWLFDE
ncbi:MAG: hypothetical protein JSW00_04025 [Thermoplasmata archaeon]|nr:MAG: hypothetical protein JSW00_04025 [Thermoplasmata archaeon]